MHYEYYAHNAVATPHEAVRTQKEPVYVPLKDDSSNDPVPQRPKSSRGRRTQDSPDAAAASANMQRGMERPKSSRGRPMRNDDHPQNYADHEYEQGSPSPRARRARPKSAKGRNRSAYNRSQPSHHAEQRHSEADVLVLDQSSSPQDYTSYGNTTNTLRNSSEEVYIDPSYAQYGATSFEQNEHSGRGDVFAADTNGR